MKYYTLITSKPKEQVISVLTSRGKYARVRSTKEETKFFIQRGNIFEFSRTPLTFLVSGRIRNQNNGSLLRFFIAPGLSSVIVLSGSLFSLVLSAVSLVQKIHANVESCDFMRVFCIIALINIIVYLSYFSLKKEIKESILLSLQDNESSQNGEDGSIHSL